MIVSYEEAINVFNKLPHNLKSFYLHPQYIVADAQDKKVLQPTFIALAEGENIFYHAFHLGRVPNTNYLDIQSPYGYGGPVCLGDKSFKEMVIRQYFEWAEKESVLAEFIRFHPLLKNDATYYGNINDNRETVYINLQQEDILKSFSTRVRTAIRKSLKCEIKVIYSKSAHYINKFIHLYDSLMDQKNAGDEYFFNDNYFIDLFKSEYVQLISIENDEGTVIGSAVFFIYEDIAEYHLSTSNDEGRKLNVSNLMLFEFAEYAKENGCTKLYLGGGNNTDPNNSLLFFKKGFSKDLVQFKIGYKIFNPDVYNQLKKKNVGNNNRILFYR